jgi:hypothetical protein
MVTWVDRFRGSVSGVVGLDAVWSRVVGVGLDGVLQQRQLGVPPGYGSASPRSHSAARSRLDEPASVGGRSSAMLLLSRVPMSFAESQGLPLVSDFLGLVWTVEGTA